MLAYMKTRLREDLLPKEKQSQEDSDNDVILWRESHRIDDIASALQIPYHCQQLVVKIYNRASKVKEFKGNSGEMRSVLIATSFYTAYKLCRIPVNSDNICLRCGISFEQLKQGYNIFMENWTAIQVTSESLTVARSTASVSSSSSSSDCSSMSTSSNSSTSSTHSSSSSSPRSPSNPTVIQSNHLRHQSYDSESPPSSSLSTTSKVKPISMIPPMYEHQQQERTMTSMENHWLPSSLAQSQLQHKEVQYLEQQGKQQQQDLRLYRKPIVNDVHSPQTVRVSECSKSFTSPSTVSIARSRYKNILPAVTHSVYTGFPRLVHYGSRSYFDGNKQIVRHSNNEEESHSISHVTSHRKSLESNADCVVCNLQYTQHPRTLSSSQVIVHQQQDQLPASVITRPLFPVMTRGRIIYPHQVPPQHHPMSSKNLYNDYDSLVSPPPLLSRTLLKWIEWIKMMCLKAMNNVMSRPQSYIRIISMSKRVIYFRFQNTNIVTITWLFMYMDFYLLYLIYYFDQ